MTTFQFKIPATLLLSQNQRLHFAAKADRTRNLRQMARIVATKEAAVKTPCTLDVLIGWPTARRRDRINVSPTVKVLTDGLVDAGVLIDDSDTHITAETYRSRVAGLKGLTVIDITLTEETPA